jgi:hypothetical protein
MAIGLPIELHRISQDGTDSLVDDLKLLHRHLVVGVNQGANPIQFVPGESAILKGLFNQRPELLQMSQVSGAEGVTVGIFNLHNGLPCINPLI